jgi:hypothetical protein
MILNFLEGIIMKKFLFVIPAIIILGIIFYSCQEVVEPDGAKTGLYSVTCTDNSPTSPVGIIPTKEDFPGGDPVCEGGVRLNDPDLGTYIVDLDGYGNTATVVITYEEPCGEVLSWSVPDNIVIDVVYVKGGTTQNVYDYTGTTPRPSSDGELHSPVNPSGGYAGISHVDFCFHYKLDVSKTAVPEFTRTYSWTIAKNADQTTLMLSSNQQFFVNYDVSVEASFIDSDWKVTGTIDIENNTPYDAVITSITDVLPGGVITLNCGLSLPYTLEAGDILNCTYSADLTSATNGTNTVTVTTSTEDVEGDVGTADFTFGDPTTEIDECIDVSDTYAGILGTVCYADLPKTFEYSRQIGYVDCGVYQVDNTASFITNDNATTGSDGHTVIVTVVGCGGGDGCTLTPGYWKTHSEKGPAPYDDTWEQLINGADTPFYLSGQTYYIVLWTPPKGNVYYILAHAYIAAQLNFFNDADPSAVQSAYDAATVLFNTYTPGEVSGFKGNDRKAFTDLATILDDYNNGLIGPGHCSE